MQAPALTDLDTPPPTITDVAALAGVSKSTVSTVVRGQGSVSDATRERVLRAVEQLGYRPNAVARQLVERRSPVIGVLVGDLDNPYHAELAARVEQAAYAVGYTTMLCNPGAAGARLDALLERGVAGIISFTPLDAKLQRRLGESMPAVFVGVRNGWGRCVAIDDREAGRLATDHLLRGGHLRIAFLTTDAVEARACHDRRAGYETAIYAAGGQPQPTITWTPGDTDALAALLRSGTTAMFASNDLAAIAVLDAADELGVRIPEDLAVAGCDDVAAARFARISLTTVSQPLSALAAAGIDLLTNRIAGAGTARDVTLGCSLLVRTSG